MATGYNALVYDGGRRVLLRVQTKTAMSLDETFCGRPINSGIESRYPLGARTVFVTDRHRLTSVAVTVQRRHTVAVLGTDSGHLLKVSRHLYYC